MWVSHADNLHFCPIFEESKISTSGGQFFHWLPTEPPWWYSLRNRGGRRRGCKRDSLWMNEGFNRLMLRPYVGSLRYFLWFSPNGSFLGRVRVYDYLPCLMEKAEFPVQCIHCEMVATVIQRHFTTIYSNPIQQGRKRENAEIIREIKGHFFLFGSAGVLAGLVPVFAWCKWCYFAHYIPLCLTFFTHLCFYTTC